MTFDVPTGGLVALVGPSGAGKSTVFSLLERFYDHDSGTITVDGRDIRDWPLAELRGSLAYVEQDAPVLAGTLRENLVFAAPDAEEKALAEAVSRTRLDTLVARLPEGSTRRWATGASPSPAANASGSPSPGPCCAAPACCCSTR